MKKAIITTTSIAASFLLGYGISSYFSKNLAATVGIATGGALFGGGATWLILDTKHQWEKNKLQNQISNLEREITVIKFDNENEQIKLREIIKTLESARDTALTQINELQAKVDFLTPENLNLKNDIGEQDERIRELSGIIEELKTQLSNTEAQRDEFKANAEFKESELKAFEDTFHEKVEAAYQDRFKRETVENEKNSLQLLDESVDILADMQAFVSKVYARHQHQREYTLNFTDDFYQYKERCDEKTQQAMQSLREYAQQQELQIGLLNQKLADGLIEPSYRDYGIASLEGKVINGLVEWCYRHLNIAFKALDFENIDDVTTFGLDYPKTQNPQTIVNSVKSNADLLAKFLGIYKITRVDYVGKYDAIAISYRHNPPKPESDDEIFKAGLIPRTQFCDSIFKATDHNKQGKPTLRIMAATGEGKGICTKHIVAYFAELEKWEVWVSDPLHGSSEDYWDCEKIAKSPNEARKAYSQFVDLHRTRKDLKVDGFTSASVLGVFDEFDKQHSEDDKKAAAKIMTAIRHTRQRQILIGQTSEVGANGWTWDDMKNCTLLVLGDSIGTLCKHLNKDLGWTLKKANEVKRQYEKFSDWAQKKNENNPDIPDENRTRIGLLVVGSKFQFLELPIPHKGIIRSPRVRSNFDTGNKSETTDESTDIKCPHCGSQNISKQGRAASGTQRYSCKDCTNSPRKWTV